jgi:hypothetical protein
MVDNDNVIKLYCSPEEQLQDAIKNKKYAIVIAYDEDEVTIGANMELELAVMLLEAAKLKLMGSFVGE